MQSLPLLSRAQMEKRWQEGNNKNGRRILNGGRNSLEIFSEFILIFGLEYFKTSKLRMTMRFPISFDPTGLMSLVANGVVLHSFWETRKQLQPPEIFLLNLNLFDGLTVLLAYPAVLTSFFLHRWPFGSLGKFHTRSSCFYYFCVRGWVSMRMSSDARMIPWYIVDLGLCRLASYRHTVPHISFCDILWHIRVSRLWFSASFPLLQYAYKAKCRRKFAWWIWYSHN